MGRKKTDRTTFSHYSERIAENPRRMAKSQKGITVLCVAMA
jgi:hypothetical protein